MVKTNTIPFPTKPLPECQSSPTNSAPRIVQIPTNPFLLTILITLHGLHAPFRPFLPCWYRVLFHNTLCTLNAALLNLAEHIAQVGYDPGNKTTEGTIREIWHILLFILELFPPTLQPHNVLDLLDGYLDSHWLEDLPRSVRAYDENDIFIDYVAENPPWLLDADPRSPRGSTFSIPDDLPRSSQCDEGAFRPARRASCESKASTDSEVSYIKRYLEWKKRKEELEAAGDCEDDDDEYEVDEEEEDYNDEEEEKSSGDDTTEEDNNLYEEDEDEEEKVKEPSSTLGVYGYLPFRL